ncbi:L-rhamnose mutarotase [Pontiella sulfatireligans]|uniref:L-rhamnose mutarotase n=1 Tax=Pontiella sulfatireligans TaxID=2750658 RepID=A0A6C2UHD3_9BACT|nr:L-rhamnose mutarotase [Pontiella sulfatireligans]VGO18821.1 hypothetical protein SCARR_00874 [Pontiella sulfatireligans]
MKLKWMVIIVSVMGALVASGLSPYENRILSGQEMHVMLFAFAKDGKVDDAKAALKTLNKKMVAKAFKKKGITNLSSYAKVLQGKTAFMVYFDYEGENYLDAVKGFEAVEQVVSMKMLLTPHPRAVQDDQAWLQLEWINYIFGAKPTDAKPEKIAQTTRIKPDREDYYRTIHQTVWPGVCDHMARAGSHDFSIFLVELGDELYQFFYVESYATEAQNEKMENYDDPIARRWYNVAAPCLDPLPGAVKCWVPMEQVSE